MPGGLPFQSNYKKIRRAHKGGGKTNSTTSALFMFYLFMQLWSRNRQYTNGTLELLNIMVVLKAWHCQCRLRCGMCTWSCVGKTGSRGWTDRAQASHVRKVRDLNLVKAMTSISYTWALTRVVQWLVSSVSVYYLIMVPVVWSTNGEALWSQRVGSNIDNWYAIKCY